MRKIVVFLLISIFSVCLHAQSENVKLLAEEISSRQGVVFAEGDVALYSDSYVIFADRIIYNKKTEDVELFGNVSILRGMELAGRTDHANMNLKKDLADFKPFFLVDVRSNVWMKSECVHMKEGVFSTEDSIVSSCNVEDPDWKITFTSGEYDQNDSYFSVFNAVFHAGDIPVFYFPYFGFSTDKTRRSGLLAPELGLGKDEGFYYLQPIYFAPYKEWDFQLDPQMRTSRGFGLYADFRFADSPYSKGNIKFGGFRENDDYFDEHELENQTHKGFEINYSRTKLLSQYLRGDVEDGLLVDITYLNDLEYLNMQDSDTEASEKTITSKINYYLRTENDYFGLYTRYYIDTEKLSNDDTLQSLPRLQYHRFTEPLYIDNLLYSMDYKATNYYRKEGLNAVQNEISIPITFHFPLLDNYLHFTVSENIYMTHVDYSKDATNDLENGLYIKNYHKVGLNSDLSKKYDSFFHTIHTGLELVVPDFDKEEGHFADFVNIDEEKKSLNAKLEQFFYDNEGKRFLTHRISQTYYFSDYEYKYGDLENELKYTFSSGNDLTNNVYYSHRYDRFSKIQTSLNLSFQYFDFSFTHTYQDAPNLTDTSFLIAKAQSNFLDKYNIFAEVDYDFKDSFAKKWEVGWTMKKRCWDYKISYYQEVVPELTDIGSDSRKNHGVYFGINLNPIGGIGYQVERKEKLKTQDDEK